MSVSIEASTQSTSAPAKRARVVFGLLTANERPETIEQLVDTLEGRPVVIHHDIEKQPALRLDRPSIHFTSVTHRTGWGTWGMCLAVLSVLEHALQHFEFDYFQLVSPSCLPLRPIAEFEADLAAGHTAGRMDLIELQSDEDFLVNYAWRMYAPSGSGRQRVLRRARAIYFGRAAERVQPFGLAVLSDRRRQGRPIPRISKVLAARVVHLLAHPLVVGQPFGRDLKAYVGSLWFCADRALCERIVKAARTPELVRYFSRLDNTDELFFPTLVGNAGRPIGPSNHLISTFNQRGNPRTFKPNDFDLLMRSGAWLARKFPAQPDAPIRRALIEARLPGSDAARRLIAAGAPERGSRLVFGTVARAGDADRVVALAQALHGRTLVVHVDPAARREWVPIEAPNIVWASEPLVGGFRPTRFNAGPLHLLRYCLECVDFDYLQLVPPNAVPTRSVDAFERFIEGSEHDAHADAVRLADHRAFLLHAARVSSAPGSLLAGLLGPDDGGPAPVRRQLARVMARALPLRHKVLRGTRLAVGSTWLGGSREAVQHLVRSATQPGWVRYATSIDDDGEVVLSTLLTDGTFSVGPSNVDERGGRASASEGRSPAGVGDAAGPWFATGPTSTVARHPVDAVPRASTAFAGSRVEGPVA